MLVRWPRSEFLRRRHESIEQARDMARTHENVIVVDIDEDEVVCDMCNGNIETDHVFVRNDWALCDECVGTA